MPETSQVDGASKPVSMDDLKALEANFKSSMDAQMDEFRNMFLELKRGLVAPSPFQIEESDLSPEEAKAKAAATSVETPGVEKDPTKPNNGSTSSQKDDDSKESYHATMWKSWIHPSLILI